jgi:hypothetical protein
LAVEHESAAAATTFRQPSTRFLSNQIKNQNCLPYTGNQQYQADYLLGTSVSFGAFLRVHVKEMALSTPKERQTPDAATACGTPSQFME